jgi:hypothetical protein
VGVGKIFLMLISSTSQPKRKRVFLVVSWRRSTWVGSWWSARPATRGLAGPPTPHFIFFYFIYFLFHKKYMYIYEVLAFWRTLRSSVRREASRMRYLLRCGPASRRPTHPPHLRCGWPENKYFYYFL